MRWKQVEKWDEASEVDQDQPKDKWSWRPPKSRDEGCRMTRRSTKRHTERDHQKFTEVHKSTEPWRQSTTYLSLNRWRSNELQKGGWLCQKLKKCALPTSQKPTGMQSTETHREVDRQSLPNRPRFYWSRLTKAQPEVDRKVYQIDQDSTEAAYRKRNQKSTVKSTKSIKILLKPPFESTTMKSTGWSPKRTSKDDYLVNQHLEVNATYRWLPLERYSTKHCTKAQESAGTLELGKYYHFRETYVLDIDV